MKSRLHLYSHSGPKTRGYIVAEQNALRNLAKTLSAAASNAIGFETTTFYGSDGHEYELVIVCDVSEEEWQQLPLPLDTKSDPSQLSVIKIYDDLVCSSKQLTVS